MKENKTTRLLFYILFLTFSYTTVVSQNFERIENITGLGVLAENNGAAVADYDGDLDLDIFVVAKSKSNLSIDNTISRLFRNNSNGTFTDVTDEAGLKNIFDLETNTLENVGVDGIKTGVSWGDYDNDGFPDLLLTSLSEVHLLSNLGDGTFEDVSLEAGLAIKNDCANMGATWFDANNDGFLDVYITDWGECATNTFYLNQGNGTFLDRTQEFFGTTPKKSSYMSFPFDFNADGWMDLYVSEDFTDTNEVYISQSGNGFIDASSSYNLDHASDDMGMAISDYNNDGFFDIYIATINLNPLFENKQNGTFEDVALQKGVKNSGWAWGPIFEDFDIDGDEDLFVTNGFREAGPIQQENRYFKNLLIEGDDSFESLALELGLSDFSTSVTPVAFDYDNDGDLDLFVSNSDKESHFYENKTIDSNQSNNLNWFQVVLQGTVSNRDAIGTVVSIMTTDGIQIRQNSSITHLSQSLKPLYFGLGNSSQIQEINIKWPSGLEETYSNFETNKSVLFIESNGFSDYAIPDVTKKMGCTDPNSCTYDSEAIIDDGSCEYLTSNNITGNTNSGFLNTESYSYTPTSVGSSFNWTVTGGEIIEGYSTNTIKVKWGIGENGMVSVKETDSQCSNELVSLQVSLSASALSNTHSIARLWNEALLTAIRGDFARPTIHARNLFHTSIALYDSWALFDDKARTYLIGNEVHNYNSIFLDFTPSDNIDDDRTKAMSYAAYRLLSHRFKNSPSAIETQGLFDFLMDELGYDINLDAINYTRGDAATLGNFIAKTIIEYGDNDGARELDNYDNAFYEPVNQSLFPANSGNPNLTDPNRWQPLSLNQFIDQSGNLIEDSKPDFLSPEWGAVNPFSLGSDTKKTLSRDGNQYVLHHDPGTPPNLDLTSENSSSEAYKWGFSMVSIWASHLDPTDNVLWDISPNSIGNIALSNLPETIESYPNFYNSDNGGDIGTGRSINPHTNTPYEQQIVPRGDYTRVLAEFWADGPDSETPPGHWFTLLNYVNDHELLEKRLNGEGEILDPLEWDVKSYFLMGGAMHDAAISAWSIKGWYDYIRPISAIRYMAQLGQSTDTTKDNYNVAGIPLKEGFIEIVEEGDALEGRNGINIGKIKLYTWKGPDYINDPATSNAGVGWILADNWWPYQRPSFVTPPFAGYVSGHSTYSRAAAEIMTLLTGDEYFPGGFGEFIARKNEFLVFEEGPSVDVKLQWATYRDASDQCSLSRIWGGIHPPADDIPGRIIGEKIGTKAFQFGVEYFDGKEKITPEENLDYIVFPNPIISEKLFIKNTSATDAFALIDILGRTIELKDKQFDTTLNTTQLRIPEILAAGVYVLTINNDSRLIIKE